MGADLLEPSRLDRGDEAEERLVLAAAPLDLADFAGDDERGAADGAFAREEAAAAVDDLSRRADGYKGMDGIVIDGMDVHSVRDAAAKAMAEGVAVLEREIPGWSEKTGKALRDYIAAGTHKTIIGDIQ